jgi:glycosyltransferase involved in cell wall biosynthesis
MGEKTRTRIRILNVLDTLDVGGAEAQMLAVLSRLPTDRYEVRVAWLRGRGELAPRFREAGIPATALRMHNLVDPMLHARTGALFREFRPHVVHTHLFNADLLAGLTARLLRVPVVVTTRHLEEKQLLSAPAAILSRRLLSIFDRVVVISNAVGDSLPQTRRLTNGHLRRIPYGYPPRKGLPGHEENGLRKELGLPEDSRLVTMVGSLTRRKGVGDLLRAASLIRDAVPRARFLLVGRGEQRRELEDTARLLDLADSVRFLGFRRDVKRILAGSDLLALPSHWEGFGLVLLEAMNAGLPIIGTRRGAIPEVVLDGETGILVPPRDPESLATALIRLLCHPEEARSMGRAGLTRLRREFDMDRAVKAHDELYVEVLRGVRRQTPFSRLC